MAAAVQANNNNNNNQMMNRENNMIPIDRNHHEQRHQRLSFGIVVSSMMALPTLLSSLSLSFCTPGNNIDDDDEEINNNDNVRANNNQANGNQNGRAQQEREIVYCCSGCSSLIADHKELVSRNFRGRNGQAFFFNKAVNVKFGKSEERDFLTGRYVCYPMLI